MNFLVVVKPPSIYHNQIELIGGATVHPDTHKIAPPLQVERYPKWSKWTFNAKQLYFWSCSIALIFYEYIILWVTRKQTTTALQKSRTSRNVFVKIKNRAHLRIEWVIVYVTGFTLIFAFLEPFWTRKIIMRQPLHHSKLLTREWEHLSEHTTRDQPNILIKWVKMCSGLSQ